MQSSECLDGWSGGGWGVFIALNHHIAVGAGCCRWAHRTVQCATGHCPVCQPRHLTVRVLEHLTVGGCLLVAPDSPVPHRTCTVHCPVRLWLLLWLLSRTIAQYSGCRVDRCTKKSLLCWCTGQSDGTLDSPVNYSEARLEKPESGQFIPVWPWCTGQSGTPDQSILSFFAPLNLNPILNIYWFMLNIHSKAN
jgi:hypothetical protein